MGFRIDCPNCGSRPYVEFWYFGELREPAPGESPEQDFQRVWLRTNSAGVQVERWYHFAGCRRCFTIRRDTTTNLIRD